MKTATSEQLSVRAFVVTETADGPRVAIRYLVDEKTAQAVAQQVRADFNDEVYPLVVRYHVDKAPGADYWTVDLGLYWPDGQSVPFASGQVFALGQKVGSALRGCHMATNVVLS